MVEEAARQLTQLPERKAKEAGKYKGEKTGSSIYGDGKTGKLENWKAGYAKK